MKEIWKDVVGYEGLYQVSNLGRVRSLDRVVNITGRGTRKLKGKLRKITLDSKGYPSVSLSSGNCVDKGHRVHRLVCEAFIPNPENKLYVDHINTVRTDNRVENLRWVTFDENMHNPITMKKIKDNVPRKPVNQYTFYGEFVKRYGSIAEAAEMTGVSVNSIYHSQSDNEKTNGKYHKGEEFYWFSDDTKIDLSRIERYIVKYDINWNEVSIHSSAKDAGMSVVSRSMDNHHQIINRCNKKILSPYYGFYFRWSDDRYVKPHPVQLEFDF